MKLWRYGLAFGRLGDHYRLDGVLGSDGMADVPELDNVILTALAEDPELRYQDAWAFWDEINAVVDAETIPYISQHESLQQSLCFHTNRPSRYTSSVAQSPNRGPFADSRTFANNSVQAQNSPLAQNDLLVQSDEQPDVLVARHSNPHLATSGRGSFVAPASQQSRSRVSTGLPTHTAPHTSSRVASRVTPAPVPSTSQNRRVLTHSSGLKRLPIILLIALAFAVLGVTIVGVWTPLGTLCTGHTHTQGASAQGTLTFFNGSFNPFSISLAITTPGPNGLQAITNGPFTILAANPDTRQQGQVSVPARIVSTGVQGNIQALTINQVCCTAGKFVAVKNTAPFTGGEDPKDYMFVLQSDVDAVLNADKVGQEQQARNAMNDQVVTRQQLLGQSVQCSSKADASQPVGDKGQNIAATQVTVTSSCHGTSYDQGTLQQAVSARISPAQKHTLVQKIAGQTINQARAILTDQIGVQNVFITIGSGNKGQLPADAGQIAIQVQSAATAR